MKKRILVTCVISLIIVVAILSITKSSYTSNSKQKHSDVDDEVKMEKFDFIINSFQVELNKLYKDKQKKLSCKDEKAIILLNLGLLTLRKMLVLDEDKLNFKEAKYIEPYFKYALALSELLKTELNNFAKKINEFYKKRMEKGDEKKRKSQKEIWERFCNRFALYLINVTKYNFVLPKDDDKDTDKCSFRNVQYDFKECEEPESKKDSKCSCEANTNLSRADFLAMMLLRPIKISDKKTPASTMEMELKYLTVLENHLMTYYPKLFAYLLDEWYEREKDWKQKVLKRCTKLCENKPEGTEPTTQVEPENPEEEKKVFCNIDYEKEKDNKETFRFAEPDINVLKIKKELCVRILMEEADYLFKDKGILKFTAAACKETPKGIWLCGPFNWLHIDEWLTGDCGWLNLCKCPGVEEAMKIASIKDAIEDIKNRASGSEASEGQQPASEGQEPTQSSEAAEEESKPSRFLECAETGMPYREFYRRCRHLLKEKSEKKEE